MIIALYKAIRLFSNEAPDYAFGEMDDEGKRRLAEFASEFKCEVQFMPQKDGYTSGVALNGFLRA